MNHYMKFPIDGKGRIFVEKEEDIFALRDIIREKCDIDHLPPNFITVFSEENYDSIPVGDFIYDMEPILYEAWDRGIKCFCVFGDVIRTDNEHMKFHYKRYGRIYVEKESDILVLKGIIIGMDAFEFDYLPNKLIAPFTNSNRCYNEYVGKFDDLNMGQVLYRAWLLGVKCFCIFSPNDYF